jgi:hypothetical protein
MKRDVHRQYVVIADNNQLLITLIATIKYSGKNCTCLSAKMVRNVCNLENLKGMLRHMYKELKKYIACQDMQFSKISFASISIGNFFTKFDVANMCDFEGLFDNLEKNISSLIRYTTSSCAILDINENAHSIITFTFGFLWISDGYVGDTVRQLHEIYNDTNMEEKLYQICDKMKYKIAKIIELNRADFKKGSNASIEIGSFMFEIEELDDFEKIFKRIYKHIPKVRSYIQFGSEKMKEQQNVGKLYISW